MDNFTLGKPLVNILICSNYSPIKLSPSLSKTYSSNLQLGKFF